MTLEHRPQQDLKADVKRWLKARGLDYKWLAGKCFVSEVTVYNWMAKKGYRKSKSTSFAR